MELKLSKAAVHALGAVVLTAGFATSAQAVVIYNNFGAGDSFQENIGYTVGVGFDQGVGFIAGATGLMTSVDVGMGVSRTPPKTVNFTLYADNGANNIGAILETFSIVVNNPFATEATSSGLTAGSTLLTAGTKYWLIAHSVDDTIVAWGLSDGEFGDRWVNGSVQQSNLAVFRINADEARVPAPGVLALLGLGLLGAGLARRRAD